MESELRQIIMALLLREMHYSQSCYARNLLQMPTLHIVVHLHYTAGICVSYAEAMTYQRFDVERLPVRIGFGRASAGSEDWLWEG